LNRPIDRTVGSKLALDWRVLGILNCTACWCRWSWSACTPWAATGASPSTRRACSSPPPPFIWPRLFSVILVRRRVGSAYLQTILQATLDIVVLMLLLHASGGVSSGLGLLLLVPVGSLAFLLPPKSALFWRPVTVIAVLRAHDLAATDQPCRHQRLRDAGLLGIVLFTSSAAASFVAASMRHSEALVRQKDVDLANLAELSQYIVQHLREASWSSTPPTGFA